MIDAIIDYYKQDEQRNIQNRENDKRLEAFLDELSPVVKSASCRTQKRILIVNADKKYSSQFHDGYKNALKNCRAAVMKSLSDLNRKTGEIWDVYEADVRNADESYNQAFTEENEKLQKAYKEANEKNLEEAQKNINEKIRKILKDLDGTIKIGFNTTEYENFKNALKGAAVTGSYGGLVDNAKAYIAAKTADGNTPSSPWGKARLNAAQEIVAYIHEQQRAMGEKNDRLRHEWQQKLRDIPGKVPDELKVTRPEKEVSENKETLPYGNVRTEEEKALKKEVTETSPLDKLKEKFAFSELSDSVKYKELSVETVNAERNEIMQEKERIRKEAEAQKLAEEKRIEEELRQREEEKRRREEEKRLAALNTVEGREMARRAEEISVYGIDLKTRTERRAKYLKNGMSVSPELVLGLWDAIDKNGNDTSRLPGTHRGRIATSDSELETVRKEFLPNACVRFLYNEYDADPETCIKATEKIVNIIDDYITGDRNNDLGKIYSVIRNELFLPKDGKPAMISGYDGVDRFDEIVDSINYYIDKYARFHENIVCEPGKTPREMVEAGLTKRIVQKFDKAVSSGLLSRDNADLMVNIASDLRTTNHQREMIFYLSDKSLSGIQNISGDRKTFQKALRGFLAANERTPFRYEADGKEQRWAANFIGYVKQTQKMAASDPTLAGSIRKNLGMEKK